MFYTFLFRYIFLRTVRLIANFFSWLSSTPLKNTVISGLIGAGITYLFTIFKMKKERKIEFEKAVGSKIASSLYVVREVIAEANVIDIYDFDNSFTKGATSSKLDNFAYYPGILNDSTTLLDFYEKINDVRREHELYISYTSSAYLLYMSDYLTKLISFLGHFENIDYHLVGSILIFDIQSWQKEFDEQLVKEINQNPLKLTTKTGKKWEREKEKINNKYWTNSLLRKMIKEIELDSININDQIFELLINLTNQTN